MQQQWNDKYRETPLNDFKLLFPILTWSEILQLIELPKYSVKPYSIIAPTYIF